MKIKNILLIMPYGSVGGMERLALNLYNEYKEKGYNVKALKFIKLDSDIINFGEDELYLKKSDFSSFSSFNRYKFYLQAPFLIRKIIKSYKIDYSIAFGDMANIFSSLTLTSEFKIGGIHSLKSIDLKQNSLFNKFTKIGFKTTYKKFNKLVCISNSVKNDLVSNCKYPFNNLEVIYNPHNTNEIIKLGNKAIETPEEVTIFSKKTILFLGRLSPVKAPWHIINALHHIKDANINLVLIGDGDENVINYLNKLIDKYSLKNNVFFLGRKTNPYKYIKTANTLVLTSNYEGTPNVIVESMVLHTPVVSSNCTEGISELMSLSKVAISKQNIEVEAGIITPNFYNGSLEIPTEIPLEVSYEEIKLAEALTKVLNSETYKSNLKVNGNTLLSKFNLEKIANQYLS